MQHLEGNAAAVAEVLREIDRGHPTAPEFALEAVAVSKGSGKFGWGFGHRPTRPGTPGTLARLQDAG